MQLDVTYRKKLEVIKILQSSDKHTMHQHTAINGLAK